MGWDSSTQVMTFPYTDGDLQTMLNTTVNTDLALWNHDGINMWSRFKPVVVSSISGEWWKGDALNCGITFPYTSNYQNIKGMYTSDKKNGWGYAKPTTNLRDDYFNKYKHNATPPYSDFIVNPSRLVAGTSLTFTAAYRVPDTDKTKAGSVDFEDIMGVSSSGDAPTNLDTYYVGCVIYDNSGNYKTYIANGTPGGAMGQISTAGLALGTYWVYPMFARVSMAQDAVAVTNVYIPFPNISAKSFQVTTAQEVQGLTIQFLAVKPTGSLGQIQCTINITNNNSSGSITLTNNSIVYRKGANTDSSAATTGEGERTFSDITVAAGQTSSTTVNIINRNLDASASYTCWLKMKSGQYNYNIKTLVAQDVVEQ